MLGSATHHNWVDSEEWAQGIAQNWVVASILLRSANKNDTVLGPGSPRTWDTSCSPTRPATRCATRG